MVIYLITIMSETMSKQIMVRLPGHFYKEVEEIAAEEDKPVASVFRELARLGAIARNQYLRDRTDPIMSDEYDEDSTTLEDLIRMGGIGAVSRAITDAVTQNLIDVKILIAEYQADIAEERADYAERKAELDAKLAELDAKLAALKSK